MVVLVLFCGHIFLRCISYLLFILYCFLLIILNHCYVRDVPTFCHLYSASCLDTPHPSGRVCMHIDRAREMAC
jgi:hypothetical protein